MSRRIDRVETRTKLPIRREPYWFPLARGRGVGFRKMTATGTWLARVKVEAEGGGPVSGSSSYKFKQLGDFAEVPEKERFDEAKKAAEGWFLHLDAGGSFRAVTVSEACRARVEAVRAEKSKEAADALAGYFRRLVYSDPIAAVEIGKAKKQHFLAFANRVRKAYGLPLRDDDPARPSKLASYNRAINPIRAALNAARQAGAATSDQAWSEALKAEGGTGKQVGRRREIYLTPQERTKLIEKAAAEVRAYLRVMCVLPLRPGEVANIRVSDFDARHGTLKVRGKTGERDIPLGAPQTALLKECAKGKTPKAWMLAKADGSQWTRWDWQDQIRDAVKMAELPTGTTAYVLRHCVLTDLIGGGLDLVTASKLSGTSLAMIDKHYGKLRAEPARAALDRLVV